MKTFKWLLLIAVSVSARAQSSPVPGDWRTPTEKTDYRTTPRYDETMAYVRRIAAAAPRQVRVDTFGKTGEGRDQVAVTVVKVSGDHVKLGISAPKAMPVMRGELLRPKREEIRA